MTTSRRAFSLVEVLVSVAILGLAMAPIVGLVHKSFSDIRLEKDEATAATLAGQILNQILFEAKYDEVLAKSYTTPDGQAVIPSGNKTVDGTYVQWDVVVKPMSSLRFIYRRYKYHAPDGCGAAGIPNLQDDTKFYQDEENTGSDQWQYNRPWQEVDKKNSGLAAVMCECELKIRWRPPGVTAFTKEEKLYVRRAKLD